MYGSMADIQSSTAEIRRGKKERRKKKPQGKNTMVCPIPQGDHKKQRAQHDKAAEAAITVATIQRSKVSNTAKVTKIRHTTNDIDTSRQNTLCRPILDVSNQMSHPNG